METAKKFFLMTLFLFVYTTFDDSCVYGIDTPMTSKCEIVHVSGEGVGCGGGDASVDDINRIIFNSLHWAVVRAHELISETFASEDDSGDVITDKKYRLLASCLKDIFDAAHKAFERELDAEEAISNIEKGDDAYSETGNSLLRAKENGCRARNLIKAFEAEISFMAEREIGQLVRRARCMGVDSKSVISLILLRDRENAKTNRLKLLLKAEDGTEDYHMNRVRLIVSMTRVGFASNLIGVK